MRHALKNLIRQALKGHIRQALKCLIRKALKGLCLTGPDSKGSQEIAENS